MKYVQRCPCVARIANARQDAARFRRLANIERLRAASHDDITDEVMEERANAALARAVRLASARTACPICGDRGFVAGNGSAARGGPGSSRNPSDQLASVRIA